MHIGMLAADTENAIIAAGWNVQDSGIPMVPRCSRKWLAM